MRRLHRLQGECEVYEFDSQTYFLMSGRSQPGGLVPIIKEMFYEEEIYPITQIIKASLYGPNLLHIMIAASKQLMPRGSLQLESDFFYTSAVRKMLKGEEDFDFYQYFQSLRKKILFLVDFKDFLDTDTLDRILKYLSHPNVYFIFLNVSKRSSMERFVREHSGVETF
jgi:hypothetical protein